MFATLILQLPTEEGYTGGKLVVNHYNKTKNFDAHMVSTLGFSYTVFFADYELEKIKTGTRLCLAFNLVNRDCSLDPRLREYIFSKVEEVLQPILEQAFPLQHEMFLFPFGDSAKYRSRKEFMSFLDITPPAQGPPTLPQTDFGSGRNVVHSTYKKPTQLEWISMEIRFKDSISLIPPPLSTDNSGRWAAVVRPTFKNPTVVIRPPKWTGSTFRMRAATYEEAQYIADAVLYYVGREPIHFPNGKFQYPPLCLGSRRLLTREKCREYVKMISHLRDPELQRFRRSYMESVEDLVLTAVKSPEVVLILRSLCSISCSTTHLDEIQDGRIAVDGNNAASTERKSHFAVNDDDDPTVYVSGFTGIGSDWFDSEIIPLTKTSSSMEGFVITLDGFLRTLEEDVQSAYTEDVNSGILEDIASRQEYQQNVGDTSQSNGRQSELLSFPESEAVDAMTITERDLKLGIDQQHELFTYPEGEADAVTITKRDMESLQPMMYLSDNIIDFYIKYLERRLSMEDKLRSYFLSSFFFTKLLGNKSASIDIGLCEVDHAQVRKWTREVNLFEKDYIFIPVLKSAHWSLIIISHLSSLMSSPEKKNDSPCIFHLDSIEGMHEGMERHVRSYVYQACREMYQASNKKEEMLLAVASRMKYVQAKVPQQGNGSDCGLYILQYVETFLFEPPCFSLASNKWGAHFAREVSGKRMAIKKLILDCSQMSQEQPAESMDIPDLNQAIVGGCIKHMQNYGTTIMLDGQVAENTHPVYPSTSEVLLENQQQPKGAVRKRSTPPASPTTSPPRKRSVSAACALPLEQNSNKKWTDKETSELLSALLGGNFCRGKRGGMHWDDVNILDSEGRRRTKTQCQNRYDVLSRAYKTMKGYIDKNSKPFSEVTKKERLDMKLATPLSEKWYMDLDEYHCRPHNVKSSKRAKLNPGIDQAYAI